MYEMKIKSSIRDYRLEIIDDFEGYLNNVYNDGDFIIVDEKVYYLYSEKFDNEKWQNRIIRILASEETKNYLALADIIEKLIENGFRKNNTLIAIGGGVTQDVTAFIASIMFRGVDWVFFPTTLLAQGDSCIGSKTSINFKKYKNQIGNFYSPREIFVDLNFLKTLDKRDLISGLGEMAHYFLVASEDDFKRFKDEFVKAQSDFKVLKDLLWRSLQIKKSYIEIDEFDKNERQVFNYGHSFGHAIETLTNYQIPHGVAVSIGMDMANFISVKYGYLTMDKREEMREMLKQIWQGYSIKNINLEDMKNALRKDKKNKGELLGLILTKGPGKTFKVYKELDENFSHWLTEYFQNEFER
jgi:3-dehydroquinate synthase